MNPKYGSSEAMVTRVPTPIMRGQETSAVPDLHHRLNDLEAMTDRLTKVVSELADRLSPVMLQSSGMDPCAENEQPHVCAISQRVYASTEKVQRVVERISETIKQLQV